MESLRSAATAAASYVGLGGTPEEGREGQASHIAGGEAPQNAATGTSQSGVEPVSGRLGRGEAGEPYDAGNLDGAAGLSGSSAQNPSSGYTSQSTTGHSHNTGTGLGSSLTGSTGTSGNSRLTGSGLGSNTTSAKTTSSEPISEKVRETFGVGGSNKQGTGLGGRDGPGYGTASKHDKDSSLGSVIGHGSNPDKYLYNSKTAPGLGGHRLGDDFTDSNTRHEGGDSLPAHLGSDAAAGKAEGSTGRIDNDRYASGIGESVTQKAKDYLPGTSGQSNTQYNSALTGATAAMTGSGRNEPGYDSSTYGSGNISALPVRTHDSTLAGDRGLAGSSFDGTTVGGIGSGLTGAGSSGFTGGLTNSSATGPGTSLAGVQGHSHGISGLGDDPEHEGYKPHGGHPIGEAAHSTVDGKQTWLDYRHDPNLPVARANPTDL